MLATLTPKPAPEAMATSQSSIVVISAPMVGRAPSGHSSGVVVPTVVTTTGSPLS